MELKKCSICGKDRFDKLDKDTPLWKTDIIVVDGRYAIRGKRTTLHKKITICPKCRELPLNKIFVDTWFGGKDEHNR